MHTKLTSIGIVVEFMSDEGQVLPLYFFKKRLRLNATSSIEVLAANSKNLMEEAYEHRDFKRNIILAVWKILLKNEENNLIHIYAIYRKQEKQVNNQFKFLKMNDRTKSKNDIKTKNVLWAKTTVNYSEKSSPMSCS